MRQSIVVAGLLVLAGCTSLVWSEVLGSNYAEFAVFDVGQGDAIYFETKQGHQILIDGGPDSTVLSRLGEVMPFWDRSLDLVVLTHPDADHITGLVPVLERYKVDMVMWTEMERDTNVFKAFQEALLKNGAEVNLAEAGDRIRWSEHPDGSLLILYPFDRPAQNAKSNETSIIAKLSYGKASILLTGDTVARVERQLAEQGIDLAADILKVAHHGSSTSSAQEFLRAVGPGIAVISAGEDNRFGHPAPEILARLEEYGIDIRRTDQEGTIYFSL